MSRLAANGIFFLYVVLIGVSIALIKTVADEGLPLTLVLLRFLFASGLALLLFSREIPRLGATEIRWGLTLGAFLGIGCITQILPLHEVSASRVSLIQGLSVLFVPLVGFVVARHLPSLPQMLGTGVALSGLWILSAGASGAFAVADALLAISALFFSLHIYFLSHVLTRAHSLSVRGIALVQFVGGAVVLLPVTLAIEGVAPSLSGPFLLVALFLGTITSVAIQTSQFYVQRFTTATDVALLFTLQPVIGSLIGVIALGESLSQEELLGGGIMLLGVLLTQPWHEIFSRSRSTKGPGQSS